MIISHSFKIYNVWFICYPGLPITIELLICRDCLTQFGASTLPWNSVKNYVTVNRTAAPWIRPTHRHPTSKTLPDDALFSISSATQPCEPDDHSVSAAKPLHKRLRKRKRTKFISWPKSRVSSSCHCFLEHRVIHWPIWGNYRNNRREVSCSTLQRTKQPADTEHTDPGIPS